MTAGCNVPGFLSDNCRIRHGGDSSEVSEDFLMDCSSGWFSNTVSISDKFRVHIVSFLVSTCAGSSSSEAFSDILFTVCFIHRNVPLELHFKGLSISQKLMHFSFSSIWY